MIFSKQELSSTREFNFTAVLKFSKFSYGPKCDSDPRFRSPIEFWRIFWYCKPYFGWKKFLEPKTVKKSQKIFEYILYMKIGRFSMGDRNLGSESPLGQRKKNPNLETAVKLNSRVEPSSCLEKMNLWYKPHFLRRFLEIRLSVFFGKKSEIFKTLRKNFKSILKVWRGGRPGDKERKKIFCQKGVLFFFFFFFFLRKMDYFFRGFEVPWGLAQCWAPFRATRLDVASVKMASNCQKMPNKGYIVMDISLVALISGSPEISWFLTGCQLIFTGSDGGATWRKHVLAVECL